MAKNTIRRNFYPRHQQRVQWLGLLVVMLIYPVLSIANGIPAANRANVAAQTVTGTVTDGNGEPLPGVNILVKGTTTGTLTDADGSYEISVPSLQDTLVFSYVGYSTQSMPISGRTTVDIKMQSKTFQGKGMVVIGYGTAKKKDLPTSIESVEIGDKAQTQSLSNVGQFLQGTVAGLHAGLASGRKGATGLEVRGRNSIKASSSPLIVLDGTPYSGNLQSINPNDIQSINVLKDATAAAVYGASAAGGVIEITTKHGTSSVPTVTFNGSVGFTEVGWNQRPRGPEDYLQQLADGLRRKFPGKPKFYYTNPQKLPEGTTVDEWLALDPSTSRSPKKVWLGRIGLASNEIKNVMNGKTINWYDQAYQKGLRTNDNISISGQENNLNYYWSLGYTNNQSIKVGDRFQAVRTRLNVSATIADFIKVGINSQYANRDNGFLPVNTGQVPNQSPYGDKYEKDGSLKWYPDDKPVVARNPFLWTKQSGRRYYNKVNDLRGSIYAKLVSLPAGLSYKVRWTNNFLMKREYTFNPSTVFFGVPGGNSNRNERTDHDWALANILKWKKTITEDHNFDLTLLYKAEGHPAWRSILHNENFLPNEVLGFSGINSGTNPTVNNNDKVSTGTALMGRLNYQFKGRYLLTLSYRRDGYSAFGEKHPFAYFPSAAVGWIISDEPFWNFDAINNLKLRGSWGKNGNRSIGIYSALQRYNAQSYIYGTSSVKGVTVSNMANPNLKWETTTSSNIGLDFGLRNNRFSGSIDAYYMSTTDMLLPRSLPDISGYKSVFTNIGEVTNKGLELSLKSQNIRQSDFTWNSSLTFSANRNKVKHLYGKMVDIVDEEGNIIGQKEASDRKNGWFIGHALNQVYDYKILGIWQKDEAKQAAKYGKKPGDFRLLDVNGDGALTPIEDKVFQGHKKPQYRLSLENDFNYKNFELSAMLISYLDYYGKSNVHQNVFATARTNYYDFPYWTPENPTSDWARLDSRARNPSFNYWGNQSFIRLQNVSLAYNVPTSLLQKFNIKRLQAHINVRNAYVVGLAGWDFWDPETHDEAPRIYSLGITLSL